MESKTSPTLQNMSPDDIYPLIQGIELSEIKFLKKNLQVPSISTAHLLEFYDQYSPKKWWKKKLPFNVRKAASSSLGKRASKVTFHYLLVCKKEFSSRVKEFFYPQIFKRDFLLELNLIFPSSSSKDKNEFYNFLYNKKD